uniref:NADH-ubiquinone oxidoreductase chain 3 n=1 Tax=Dolomedes angustivirgatus TaxID=492287 RepID=A0A1C8V697_9ARAC|nr:NADH dehydrogenase subunit 3 [Dolomedes angustivirgatus]ANW36385.1 NADH dehydrogenase subunit 3 [Dolomedes angustivirgatus]
MLMGSIVLVMMVYLLFFFIFYKCEMGMEIMSSYECGFDPSSFTRLVFSYRFFLISILFIIFDVEISLMLPIPFLMSSLMGVVVFFSFIFVLLVGLIYEYFYGSLDWLDYY